MQGIKQRTSKLFYQFSLEEHICPDHPLRRIDQELDLRFLYKQTRTYYGKEGQKSIDPVVFFKICLVGYFHNITSDRALIRYIKDSLSARWFIGYDIDQPLPVHSTLSRTRAVFGEQVYEKVFSSILALCVDAGLVQGTRQVVDSALVKANAHINSMQRKQILEDASEYCRQVNRENSDLEPPARTPSPTPSTGLESVGLPGENKDSKRNVRLTNDTHQCSSDPDARMSMKPTKPKDMYYHGQVCVDSQHGVVTAAMGDYGNRKDPQSFPELLAKARKNLGKFDLSIKEVLADGGYTSGENISLCEQADRYECSQGEYLTYRSTQTRENTKIRTYRTFASQCKNCPIKAQCITSKGNYKQLKHSDGKPWYDLMDERLRSAYGKRMVSKRKAIVEPALGNLLHQNGMKKVYARGIQAANKHVMLASMSLNLKKWLRYSTNTLKKKAHRAEVVPWNRNSSSLRQIYWFLEHILAHFVKKHASQPINLPVSSIF